MPFEIFNMIDDVFTLKDFFLYFTIDSLAPNDILLTVMLVSIGACYDLSPCHQAITWTSVDLPPVRYWGIFEDLSLRGIMLKI